MSRENGEKVRQNGKEAGQKDLGICPRMDADKRG
jgi:hypothetical protein